MTTRVTDLPLSPAAAASGTPVRDAPAVGGPRSFAAAAGPAARGPAAMTEADSDEALLGRLVRGDPVAGETLVLRYHDPLLRYLRRLAGPAAEELHQQTWLSVLEHAGRFDARIVAGAGAGAGGGAGAGAGNAAKPGAGGPGGGFKPWLFRIATNKANDLWRRRRRDRPGGDPALAADPAAGVGPALEAAEAAERLRAAIDRLPEAQRQVLLMRYYGRLKFVEIAAALGCPLNTALGRMHKAVARLKTMLEDGNNS